MEEDTLIIRDVKEKNSVCIVTPICWEHDFLPNMIEHNVKCGVSQFIFLIHDYGLSIPQLEYKIPEEFKSIVTLIRIDTDWLENNGLSFFDETFKKQLKNKKGMANLHFHIKMVNWALGLKNIHNVKTDWILAIGVDQFLSLEKHNSLPEFLAELDDDCDQVFIPWSCMFYNLDFQIKPTFPEILKNGHNESVSHFQKSTKHVPCNGLVRKKDMAHISDCSHFFASKNHDKNKIFCNGIYYPYTGEIFQKHPALGVWADLVNKASKNNAGYDASKLLIHSVHAVCRGFFELITCNLSWKSHEVNVIWNKYNKPDPLLEYCKVFLDYIQGRGNGNIGKAREELKGGREIPSRMHPNMLLQTKESNFDRLKNIKIANWKYKYKITNNYYNDFIWSNFKKFGFSKRTLLEIFDKNLQSRNVKLHLSDIIQLKDTIWATDSDDESDKVTEGTQTDKENETKVEKATQTDKEKETKVEEGTQTDKEDETKVEEVTQTDKDNETKVEKGTQTGKKNLE